MKKLFLVLLVAIIAIPTFQSCKKGENDPTISLKSRKARLVGEWNLISGTRTNTNSSGTSSISYNGTTAIETNSGGTDTYVYTEKVTIDKDGTYEIVVTEGTSIYTQKGAWYFGRKNKELDIKDKETVCFALTSYTDVGGGTTYSGSYTGTEAIDYPSVWQLDELKSKEMIVLIDGTSISGSSTSTHTGTLTYEKK
jgi:hypothetical protein